MANRHGATISKIFGDVNEKKNHIPFFEKDIPAEEEWMDYYNNQKGREINERIKAQGGNEEDIKRATAEAIEHNELVVTPFDPRRTFDEHGDFERAVKESEQQMEQSWYREMSRISGDEDLSVAERQEVRQKMSEIYQEYERQFNNVVERERAKNSENQGISSKFSQDMQDFLNIFSR